MTLRVDPNCRPGKKSKRRRSAADEQRKAIIKEALKLDKLRLSLRKREACFIFVGNVSHLTGFSPVVPMD